MGGAVDNVERREESRALPPGKGGASQDASTKREPMGQQPVHDEAAVVVGDESGCFCFPSWGRRRASRNGSPSSTTASSNSPRVKANYRNTGSQIRDGNHQQASKKVGAAASRAVTIANPECSAAAENEDQEESDDDAFPVDTTLNKEDEELLMAKLGASTTSVLSSVYHDAQQEGSISLSDSGDLIFFDAEEYLQEEEDYPIITKSYIPKRPPRELSMVHPDSLLRRPSEDGAKPVVYGNLQEEINDIVKQQPTIQKEGPASIYLPGGFTAQPAGGVGHHHASVLTRQDTPYPDEEEITKKKETTLSHHHYPHHKRTRIPRRGTAVASRDLIKVRATIVERGYPGQLNKEELEQCQIFYRAIHKDEALKQMVYQYADVEEEPYSICRFLRATKFSADKSLQRLRDMTPVWQAAAADDFYPNLDEALGVPLELFLAMYPFLYYGNAKNGCPVNYFQAGRIHTEGLLCLCTCEIAPRYYWHQFYHKFRRAICETRQLLHQQDLCRCETVAIVDLQGLSSSQLSSEAMEVLKHVSQIGNMFPETLHCMMILNAPTWFSVSWKLIKSFLDPRTAKKIEVYGASSSSQKRGRTRLHEMIDSAQLPADYGGLAPSTTSLLAGLETTSKKCDNGQSRSQQQSNADVKHQASSSTSGNNEGEVLDRAHRVLQLKKAECQTIDNFVTVAPGQELVLEVYTRSISGAKVSVYSDTNLDKPVCTANVKRSADTAKALIANNENPAPYSTQVYKLTVPEGSPGSSRISVKVQGLSDVDSVPRRMPQGTFLLVGTVYSCVVATVPTEPAAPTVEEKVVSRSAPSAPPQLVTAKSSQQQVMSPMTLSESASSSPSSTTSSPPAA